MDKKEIAEVFRAVKALIEEGRNFATRGMVHDAHARYGVAYNLIGDLIDEVADEATTAKADRLMAICVKGCN